MKILLTILMATLGIASNGQTDSRDWTLVKSSNGVNIYQQEADCFLNPAPDQKWYLLKVENTNDSPVKVEWDARVWYNDECANCDDNTGESHTVIELNGNSSVSGKCEIPGGSLYIFRDFISFDAPTKLTKYELQNLLVVINK